MPDDDGDVARLLARIRARAAAQRAADVDPAAIGPYRVERRLGQGGMGAVYLCAAAAPLERQVAIKLVRPGLGGAAVLARFRREQRAIARLEHEHIARVFDAGTTGDGRPFLVMEFVDGQPLDAFCRARSLPLAPRLRLFLQVCLAVEHAHLRGFVHRDLKPQNVLACERDGRAAVKVIDFGLAAVDDDALADDDARTLPGQVLGTPGYMSPEQAAGSDQVDARTDVYSLGVLLHELVTGARGERTPSGPLRPSAALRARADAAGAVPREFGTDAPRLLRQLRGDLDWVVEHATALAPQERYQTVHALAYDVRLVRTGRPIPTRPSGVWYRLRKRAAQNRLATALAIGVLGVLGLGVTGTLVGLVEARANLTLFEHLASAEVIRRAEAAEAALYPPVPARIPAMQRWLARYRAEAHERLQRLREAVTALQARAVDEPEDVRQRDRETSPAWQRLQKQRGYAADTERRLAASTDPAERARIAEELATLRRRCVELEREAAAVRVYRFASDADGFLYGALLPTLGQMEQFVATAVPRVERALAWAQDLDRGHDEARAARWRAVQARIANAAVYGGLELPEQPDLVPLGPDPDSGLEEFAQPRSGSVPERDPATGRLPVDGDTALVFVLLPGGEVGWGAQASEPGAPFFDRHAQRGEDNGRTGVLDPFFVSKYEMTRGQYLRLYREDPSHWATGQSYDPQRDRVITAVHPVEHVDWPTARARLLHEGLDLPTEVQWEYACRAGSTSSWTTGADPRVLLGYANLADRDGWDDGWALHAPVGTFRPNAFGLHDVHGNVREWCRDRYGNYQGCTAAGDLLQTDVDATDQRMSRGGSFQEGPGTARCASRGPAAPGVEGHSFGLRPIRRIDRIAESRSAAVPGAVDSRPR
ncbi:MAG: bifunctional serine/threonine-protein kinase/formylglycine-generating enzyme family protein [Planctomycetota bacterium]